MKRGRLVRKVPARDDDWHDRIKPAIFARDRWKCLWCGGAAHDVHHLVHRGADTGIVDHHASWNLISLCRRHHTEAESGPLARISLLRQMRAVHGYEYDWTHYEVTGWVSYVGGGPM